MSWEPNLIIKFYLGVPATEKLSWAHMNLTENLVSLIEWGLELRLRKDEKRIWPII